MTVRRLIVRAILVLALVWCLPLSSHAAPIITQDLVFIENRPADDIFGNTGLKLVLDVTATDPGGSGALTGPGAKTQATSNNATFPFAQPVTISFNSFFGLQGVEFTSVLSLSGVVDF